MELSYVFLNKPFGFHLPPREVVHANIKSTVDHMQISSLKSVIVKVNGIFSQEP